MKSNYCEMCGSRLDITTGICPHCNAARNRRIKLTSDLLCTVAIILISVIILGSIGMAYGGYFKRDFYLLKLNYSDTKHDNRMVSEFEQEKLVDDGSAGAYITWKLDANGVLLLSGTGELSASTYPWTNYKSEIRTIIISQGITTIGQMAFRDLTNLSEVLIADSVTHIGDEAFSGCVELKTVCIPNSVISIGNRAFARCSKVEEIVIPIATTFLGDEVFSSWSSHQTIILPSSKITPVTWADDWKSNCDANICII